ncbi:efflux RND transporter periplasmic adaptor subunit [Glaciecola petra]|uniref:Efflux RND transporter periplasmic adaptor subunit n=1 Tax=Glaciecola petra TaxID=3075602 RepID=A0ABU2ZQG5_9ALTE|nr:efflux RND transporter periplasmic adaptor subunit [Aestuariibacter sp. P117]MDT0594868.1 efflux RND transporter periplasmic adaptor subunit [Aestuariibacter sp. P117]
MFKVVFSMSMILVCTLLPFSDAVAQSRGVQERQATIVITEPVRFDGLQTNIDAVGTAEAIKSIELFPAVSDKVSAVLFVPGQFVEEGQIILELDSRRQDAALRRAKIELADAERNLTRLEKSKNNGAVTLSELDDAQTVKELAEVNLLSAQVELEDRIVRAPFAGILGLTDIEVGDRISTNTLITSLDDRSELFVNFTVPESSLRSVRGDGTLDGENELVLHPWTDREASVKARLAQIDSRIDALDRTIRVRAIFTNTDDTYLPGMSFRVNLSIQGQEYAAVPESGLAWGASGAFVWVADKGKAKRVAVQIKQRLRGKVLVEGDLNRGELLITEGISRLREGQAVRSQTSGVS